MAKIAKTNDISVVKSTNIKAPWVLQMALAGNMIFDSGVQYTIMNYDDLLFYVYQTIQI